MLDDRHLIGSALDRTLVVEAAAGTGKTTELVKRIVQLVATGTASGIEQVAAVTFSEKAAGELKLRLREELERARIAAEADPTRDEEARRLERAVQRFEEAHVSTIHGFCADLLRERPVEAQIDPLFAVLTEGQSERLYDEAFTAWIQEQLDDPGEGVKRSLRRPRSAWSPDEDDNGPVERLRRAGLELLQWRDHRARWTRPPDFSRDREIDALVDALGAFAQISANPISRTEVLFRETHDLRRAHADITQLRSKGHDDYDGWEARLCTLAAKERDLRKGRSTSGQYSRAVPRQVVCEARDMVVDALVRFRSRADADLAALVHAELQSCIDRFEERKVRAGAIDFLDLLIRARNLVRDVPDVRRDFQARFRFILVDEFQDTDPLQAELLWMLAADEPAGYTGDPLILPIRPGALFIVGDPKQSIYRFRRADVGIYRDVCTRLLNAGATAVRLQQSFRSVPAIQRAVNTAFNAHMTGDVESLQADYVELLPHREDVASQPAVVALPVPAPFGKTGVTATAINASLPEAVGEFVRWLVTDSGWTVSAPDGGRRPIAAGDVCLLFRRFIDFQDDVTRPYVEALESRGLTHLLVGGKAFHEREEVDALRTALMAIERPDDALSVFATLRGPFFAVAEEDLLAWHALGHGFRPYDVPDDAPAALAPVADALRTLRELNRLRNYRPVADTIGRLIEATRAHAGFVLWRGGEQVLANVLQIGELARQYEAEGGLSFRGFVDELRAAAERSQTPEAPILEEGTDGVRLMTVHKAKGLEFPVVILADMGCRLSRDEAQRYLDPSRGLAAIKLGGWTPLDLAEHNALEASRDRAEGVRLAYVAATRAKDLLVVPAVGDEPFERGWLSPLSEAIYPAEDVRRDPSSVPGMPPFAGKDTVAERPDGDAPSSRTVRSGAYELVDPCTRTPYSVVWWDPSALLGRGDDRRGLRRDDLITKDARPAEVAADRARYDQWRVWKDDTLTRGASPSVTVLSVTEWSGQDARSAKAAEDARSAKALADTWSAKALADTWSAKALAERQGNVTVESTRTAGQPRPSGRRFGTLTHALLAAVPLDATAEEVRDFALVHARILGASEEERASAAALVHDALAHPRIVAARDAAANGRLCLREVPITVTLPASDAAASPPPASSAAPTLLDGQIDLAYETPDGWVVVDFKTDVTLGASEEAYKAQAATYAAAVSHATGRPASAVILRL